MVSRITELFGKAAALPGRGKLQESVDNPNIEVQRKIIRVATRFFADIGYRRTNIADIAIESGIGKGSIYLHFKSKKDLFLSCQLAEELAILPQLEAIEKLPKKSKLSAYLEISLTFATNAPLSRALMSRPQDFATILEGTGLKNLVMEGHRYIAEEYINPVAKNLDVTEQETLAAVISIVITAVNYVPQSMFDTSGLKTQDLVRVLTKIIDQGTQNTSSI
jgi:AcrR family transcriptional regulator